MNRRNFVTVVGSRKTPTTDLNKMRAIITALVALGFALRSGGAEGVDDLVTETDCFREIIIPWNGFNKLYHEPKKGFFNATYLQGYTKARALALKVHPNPSALTRGAIALHTRNVYQLIGTVGYNRNELSRFVVCYAPIEKGSVTGGTRTAVVIAEELGIRVYNIYDIKQLVRLCRMLNKLKRFKELKMKK